MDLPFKQRLKLFRQSIYSSLKLGGHTPISIEPYQDIYKVIMPGHEVYVPSPLRWKLYKYGWEARLKRLKSEYGVGKHYVPQVGDIVLDIGANAGEFSLIAAALGAQVYACEPDPLVSQCLKLNTINDERINRFDYVLSHKDGDIDFYLAPDKADSSIFSVSETKIRRRGVKISTFMQEQNITHIDFIKCDAEGAEPEVLMGASDVADKIGVLAIDTGAERDGERTGQACEDILNGWGFRVFEEKIGTRWMTYGVNPQFKAGE